ncbi:zinc ABC transporter ATP-binding protein ZnuC [Cellvibrio sp. KY-GH-1]|uniref:zinc ABC transporter ATP-binding protein ZnuC n=1 Tax=Cellvibrio sp. KY-GH-1 TaxID=2303332 RepID=UPI001248D65B|nr:zinc ABC transporter ATP-binding protein ZnuC [Cellvibrio sp. KY-GH-1]QEY17366.1 zinc ABC transporter ATP-binding protein ZnuC [Cellvibrio sp. KY-GH-1]
MSEALIRARGLGVTRNGREILQKADLTLDAGKIVTLIGPNGAGKTTLVRAVLGLIKIDEGSIEKAPGLRIGYMPQKLHIDASLPLTVARFLALGGKPRAALDEILQLTGITGQINQPMQSLSGGETQRVLLARALLRDPQLLVLDEPVQGVDVTGQSALYALINEIRNRRQCGVLLVSHDLHLVMATTDTVICLNQHVCCHGHPEQVTNDPAYLALFGEITGNTNAPQVAIYTHHHDHQHDAHGNVIHSGKSKLHRHGPGCNADHSQGASCEHHHHD